MSQDNKQKVICLGLGRTGTASLRDALEMLGFGPCYHMSTIIRGGCKDLALWAKIGDGNGSTEDIRGLLDNYGSVVDYPAVMYAAELYAVYPDAKFLLSTRDPAQWEKSMKATVLRVAKAARAKPDRAPAQEAMMHWLETYLQNRYHGGRLFTDAQQELLNHNERVKHLIPPHKLLVYEIGEGWDRLVEFLGVTKPAVPFPHVNDTAHFEEVLRRSGLDLKAVDIP